MSNSRILIVLLLRTCYTYDCLHTSDVSLHIVTKPVAEGLENRSSIHGFVLTPRSCLRCPTS